MKSARTWYEWNGEPKGKRLIPTHTVVASKQQCIIHDMQKERAGHSGNNHKEKADAHTKVATTRETPRVLQPKKERQKERK